MAIMRLDQYLTAQHPEKTRAYWQRMIKKGLITIGGVAILKPKYEIEVADENPEAESQTPPVSDVAIDIAAECLEESEIEAENIPLNIIYEDADLLVIDKPAGMVVHPAYGHQKGTLINALLYHCKDLSGIGGVKRPGIVHRLDKETSGLLVVAKHDEAHVFLAQQFHPDTKEATRLYRAIVHGVPQKMEDTIDLPIAKDTRAYDRMRVNNGPEARHAITHYRVLEVYGQLSTSLRDRYALIECELYTGRTHQIRVHMSHIRHPIVGDTLYGSVRDDVRLMLHAYSLSFIHPRTKERLTFTSPMPEAFISFTH